MEYLVEATGDLLLDLTPNYDAIKQTFLLDSQNSKSGSSVRIVESKQISATHPPNTVGGGSHVLDPTKQTSKLVLHDSFSGIIDGISGNLLHGTRSYILTGEEYEGPFCNNIRHGEGAIVKNVYLPFARSNTVGDEGPRFYGTYRNDSPYDGTLVVPGCYTYHGLFLNSRPHGERATIVRSSGLKYEGGFRHGQYHGHGIETETAVGGGGVYTGQFSSGLRQGYGTYVIQPREESLDEVVNASSEEHNAHARKEIAVHVDAYKYEGQWNDNQRQGEGEETTTSGEIYRGQFHSNERHGYGMLSFRIARMDSETKGITSPDRGIITRDSSKVLISAEGIWRAGIPLDGTYGWTLTYQNGDVYTGFASNFIPFGYGVKRHVNKDVYSGEWKDGNREGEGIFISASGREEYIGTWKKDKIVPMKEGKEDARRTTLTDLTLSLLNGRGDIITPSTNMVEISEEAEQTEGEISIEPKHRCKGELLNRVMHESLSASLELLQKNSDQYREHNGRRYPQSWSSESIMLSNSKDPRAYLYDNAIKMLKMQTKDKESSDSEIDSDLGCNESESDNSDDGNEKLLQPQMKYYPNGDSYLGEICPDTEDRQGYGVYLSCATGSTYSGDFRLGLRHGFGILMHPLGKYCGDFVDDEKHGMGTLILNDSSSYFGEFFMGTIHGRGTLCEKNGTVYVGEWVHGIRDGDGYETLTDGSVYMGEYKEGKRHGVGTMLAKSGGPVMYSGSWNEGLYHGEGVAVYRATSDSTSIDFDSKLDSNLSTVQYEGSFVRGQLDGFGTLTNYTVKGSVITKGNWCKNVPLAGKWRIQFTDGSVYSGEAKVEEICVNSCLSKTFCDQGLPRNLCDWNLITPMPHGFGTMMYVMGDLFIGNFAGKKRHGIGSCEFANGDSWEGEWKNDSINKDGNGTLTMADGTVYRYCKTPE